MEHGDGIGKIERVPLREIWKNESRDFTPWLEGHIDSLSEVLNMELSVVEREKNVKSFWADLVAEDEKGELVVIENELKKTDHEHLGKLITYLVNTDAKTAVLICSEPRQEHINVVTWLNEMTPSDISFYLVKVEGIKIDDSKPAPLFSVIVKPSEESKQIGQEKQKLAQRHILRRAFWEGLLEKCNKKTDLFSNVSPQIWNYIGTGAGKTGLYYHFVISGERADVELYIDRKEKEENKKIFDTLLSHKEKIEEKFGEPLKWERLDEKKASRIRRSFREGLKNKDKWDELQEKMIDAMIKLEKSLKPYIQKLEI